MAFSVGEIAASLRPAATLGMTYPLPNLEFGTVTAVGGPTATVLWQGGLSATVLAVALDRIAAPAAPSTVFEPGQLVRPIGCECADYDGLLMWIYARDPAGAGVELGVFGLVSLLNGLGFMEFQLSELRVLEGGV
jgi:hypothetical protein